MQHNKPEKSDKYPGQAGIQVSLGPDFMRPNIAVHKNTQMHMAHQFLTAPSIYKCFQESQ